MALPGAPSFLDALLGEAPAAEWAALGVAWARVLPSALLVPAFGLGFLPASLRAAIGLGLAASFAGAAPAVPPAVHEPLLLVLASELSRGVPVAIVAATSLFAAAVGGGVVDVAQGSRPGSSTARFGRDGGPFATLLGLAACALFLDGGGPARLAERLAAAPPSGRAPLAAAVADLAAGLDVGASLGAPLLLVAPIVDVTVGLAAREVRTLGASAVAGPLRALVVLVATAVLFERIAEAIAVGTAS